MALSSSHAPLPAFNAAPIFWYRSPQQISFRRHLVTLKSSRRLQKLDDDRREDIDIKDTERGKNSQRMKACASNDILPLINISTTCVISLATSFGTLWSEYAVIMTACGPPQLSDALERGCYLSTLLLAGVIVFTRIVTRSSGASIVMQFVDNDKSSSHYTTTLALLRSAEVVNLFAVLVAFVALGVQEWKGEQLDGLSGINVEMCRALQMLD
jgi:hypothetical protein